jgi:hypothetical protein
MPDIAPDSLLTAMDQLPLVEELDFDPQQLDLKIKQPELG